MNANYYKTVEAAHSEEFQRSPFIMKMKDMKECNKLTHASQNMRIITTLIYGLKTGIRSKANL